jgi:hypothetical protein
MGKIINSVADSAKSKNRIRQKNAYDRRNPKGKQLKQNDIAMMQQYRQPQKQADDKLRAQWIGPLKVTSEPRAGTIMLEDSNGNKIGPCNVQHIKKTNKSFLAKISQDDERAGVDAADM